MRTVDASVYIKRCMNLGAKYLIRHTTCILTLLARYIHRSITIFIHSYLRTKRSQFSAYLITNKIFVQQQHFVCCAMVMRISVFRFCIRHLHLELSKNVVSTTVCLYITAHDDLSTSASPRFDSIHLVR